MSKEYVAYKGSEFQVEWYYSPKGQSPALEYYKELSVGERVKALKLFRMIGEVGK